MINKVLFALLKLISRLPFSFWYFVSDVLYFPAKTFYRRKVVVSNLRSVFPELPSEKIEEIADDFYKNFCDLIVELFKTLTISKEEIKKLSVLKNPELFDQHENKDKEVLTYSLHFANWEWLALGMSTGSDYPCSPIVHVQSSGFADEYMSTIRGRFKGIALPKQSAARYIIRNKDKKYNIGILADQSPPQNQSKHWVRFLGRETAFINGLSNLPYLTQLPCFFARFKRIARGRYEIEMVKIGDPPYEKGDLTVLKNYVRESEALIRSEPAQYLWSHKRWKYEREENEELIKL